MCFCCNKSDVESDRNHSQIIGGEGTDSCQLLLRREQIPKQVVMLFSVFQSGVQTLLKVHGHIFQPKPC